MKRRPMAHSEKDRRHMISGYSSCAQGIGPRAAIGFAIRPIRFTQPRLMYDRKPGGSMRDEIANIIGYHMAALVSRNNQPHMSGDPRARIHPHERRRFDDACQAAADRIVEALGDPKTPAPS